MRQLLAAASMTLYGVLGMAACGVPTPASTSVVNETTCGISQQEQPALAELIREVEAISGECPASATIEDLGFVLDQQEVFWSDFPARRAQFVESNFGSSRDRELETLVGMPFEKARNILETDPERPLKLKPSTARNAGADLYEFEGGLSLYIVSVREGTITGIYFLDLG